MLDNGSKPISFVDLFGVFALWFFPGLRALTANNTPQPWVVLAGKPSAGDGGRRPCARRSVIWRRRRQRCASEHAEDLEGGAPT